VPIEIAVPDIVAPSSGGGIEITLDRIVLRCEVGTDPAYLAALLRALAAEG
jgi:hypothetical protein